VADQAIIDADAEFVFVPEQELLDAAV